jgi:class 3 adenylate cyclase
MDAPQIRYARTRDGVNLAYWAVGSGPPLVSLDLPVSNVKLEWELRLNRERNEAAARLSTLVRFDHRGFGLSDKYEAALTSDALVLDLETIVDKLALGRFFLVASRGPTYPIALEYARRHPDRVIRIAAMIGGPPEEFLKALIDTPGADWEFKLQAVSRRIAGWSDEEGATELVAQLRQSTDEEGIRRFMAWFSEASRPVGLDAVVTPCLFLPMAVGGRDWVDVARELAAQMPDASIEPISGATDRERGAKLSSAIAAFFTQAAGGSPRSRVPDANGQTTSAVILFIDIVNSTALTERMGDAAFRAASSVLDERMRAAIRRAGGTPIDGKVMGDGVMATFASAREAIDAALRCNALSGESELQLHVGVHAGDVIREPGNVYGGAVNIASRICDASIPGEILVSDVVRGMARTSAGVTFEDRGEREMKGIGDPVRVYAVRPASG